MTDVEHYTTISVEEYIHMKSVILSLRAQKQKAREHLEKGEMTLALELLRQDHDR